MPDVPAPLLRQRFLRRKWVRRALPAGVAAALVVGGTAVTRANANSSLIDTYRSTTVTTGSVQQRLNVTGSVQPVNQVSEGFAVAGTVTSVPVSVGDTVTSGQSLATLDASPFHSAVTAAQASLAKARATLESDQTTSNATNATNATTGATATTPAPTASATVSPRVAGPSGRSGATASQSLTQVQARVTSAQRAVTADLTRASAALAQCVPFFPSEPSPSTTSPAPTTTPPRLPSTGSPAPATAATPATTTTASDAAIRACLAALRTAPTQQQIQRDQQTLTRSQTDLMTSVTLAITTASTSAAASTSTSSAASQSSTSRTSTGQSAASQSSGVQSSGGQNGGAGQSSASRVISDQAAVTTAESALSSAQTNLAAVTLKSSIAGTVGSVTLLTGASSSGQSVVIVGTGAVEVTVDVPLASMASVRVGQKADVTPQGATTSVDGSVISISLLPASSTATSGASATRSTQSGGTGQGSATSSSPVYPVVVLVPAALPALASGSRADVSLLIGTAAMVLTVPNSALTPLGNGQAMAVTLKNGVATRALVRTGYAGALVTQVTSGLVAGQQVALADLSTALPTNTTNARRFGVGAGGAPGGFGGSGLGGAGLGGASIPGGARFPSLG